MMLELSRGIFVWLSPEEDSRIIENINRSPGATDSERLHNYLQKCTYRDATDIAPSEAYVDQSDHGSWSQ